MAGCDMKLRQRLVMAAIASALLIAGCGEENPGTGGTSGAGESRRSVFGPSRRGPALRPLPSFRI